MSVRQRFSAVEDSHPRVGPALFVALLVASTVAAIVVGNGHPAIALIPSLAVLLVWALWRVPLRIPLLTLLALSWALESFGDGFANNLVVTPWRSIGWILWSKLNLSVPIPALVFSGFDILLVLFAVIIIHRRIVASKLDRTGWTEAPRPILGFALLSWVAIAWLYSYGLASGGSSRFALWQVYSFFYLPLVYCLMNEGLRGSVDAPRVARVVLGVGLFRALEGLVIRLMHPAMGKMPNALTHHDSVLFAACIAILVALALEIPSKRLIKIGLLLAPIYLLAMRANNRRLVWTEVAITLLFFVAITPWGRTKRKIARGLAMALPVALLYLAIGWNSNARGFGPVRTIRSLLDAGASGSTAWRDQENRNLIATFSQHPLVGTGFGHEYKVVFPMPDITWAYPLEMYIPHNSVLGIWAFGGLVGFSLLWAIFPVGLFFAIRGYRWSRTPLERATCLSAAATQICYLIQAYGDLGFGRWGPIFLVATSYALVGKICVANGAWPTRKRNRAQRAVGGHLPLPSAPDSAPFR